MKSTERFSTRVDAYRQYRPRYPQEILDVLRRDCALTPQTVIADVAAGTGLLAEIFLANGNPVIAVEPNGPMRAVCDELRTTYPRLRCFDGTAESTGLAENSVDMSAVGQAMHWFDLDKTRAEFQRVLRPGGWCVVIYNHRKMRGDPFHEDYERLLTEYGKDYRMVQDSHMTEETLADFFRPATMRSAALPNSQDLLPEALHGRVLSSSYMPQKGDPNYAAMAAAVDAMFARHAKEGLVRMEYECAVCYGPLV